MDDNTKLSLNALAQQQILNAAWPVAGQFIEAPVVGNLYAADIVFRDADGEEAVRITFDPPAVTLAPGVEWNGAAKMFWNAVCRMAGHEPPFGW